MYKEMLKKAREGDKEARDLIVMHHMRVVKNVIQEEFKNEPYEEEDLLAFGVIGLIEAIDTYREEIDTSFVIHARHFIFNRIMTYINYNNKILTGDVSLDELRENDEESTVENTPVDYSLTDYVLILNLRDVLESLSPREKEMIRLHFGFETNASYSRFEDSTTTFESSIDKVKKGMEDKMVVPTKPKYRGRKKQ